MAKIYKQPFAHDGDAIVIPDVSQPDGKMSTADGWTPDYQLPKTDPNYKPVGRQEMNGVFKEVTEALGQMQVQGAATWPADGAPYPVSAQVYHNGKQWIALRANSVEPDEGEDWSAGDAVLRQDLANPDKGAAMVARGVVAVGSIADLLALPEGQRKEGLRYLVKGYHAGSDVGGGEFYWESSLAEQNNGGTVIEGWVRVLGDYVTPEMFGAVGDGTADDSAAIQAAFDVYGHVRLLKNSGYFISNKITVPPNSSLIGKNKDSILISDVDGYFLEFSGVSSVEDLYTQDTGKPNASGAYFPAGSPLVSFRNVNIDSTDAAIGFAANGGSDFSSIGGRYWTAKTQGTAAAVRVLGDDSGAVPRKFYGPASGGCTLFDFGGAGSFYVFGGYTNGLIFSSSAASQIHITDMRIGAAGGEVFVRGSLIMTSCILAVEMTLTADSGSCKIVNTESPGGRIKDFGINNSIHSTVIRPASDETFLITSAGNEVSLPNSVQRSTITRSGRSVFLNYYFELGGGDTLPSTELMLNLPYLIGFTAHTDVVGHVIYRDAAGSRIYHGLCYPVVGIGGNKTGLRFTFNDTLEGNYLAPLRPFTWNDGSWMRLSIIFNPTGQQGGF